MDFVNVHCSSPPLSVSCNPKFKPLGKKAKELLTIIKDLNHIFAYSQNLISSDYFDMEDFKKAKIKSQDLSILQ